MTPSDDSLSLVNLVEAILERVIEGFDAAGVELPERRFYLTGTPAADCEQIAVSFKQGYVGPPGDEANEPQRCNSPRTAQIDIQIIRKIPTLVGPKSRPPAVEAIQEAARLQLIDAWTLLDISCSLDMWDDMVPGAGLGVIATVDAGEPQGAMQGTTLHLTVAIP